MKILKVVSNNRKRAFEVYTRGQCRLLPYAATDPTPNARDRVLQVHVDEELGNEGFSYVLESGAQGTVHMDHVLEYNKDLNYVTDMLLYRLTLEAQRRIKESPLSRRELIRRLGTSAAQFYRLLDQTNYRKSVRQMLSLLYLLDCEIDLVVKTKKTA